MKALILESFIDVLTNPNTLVGIILTILGLGLAMLAKRITMAVRKTTKIDNNDTINLTLLAFALVFILVGLVVSIIR